MPKDWQHTDDKFTCVEIADPDEALSQNIIRLMLMRFAKEKQRQDWLNKRSTKNQTRIVTTDEAINRLSKDFAEFIKKENSQDFNKTL